VGLAIFSFLTLPEEEDHSMLPRSPLASCLLALFVVLMATPLYAGTINACVKNNSGAVRIVAPGVTCASSESALSWDTGLNLPFAGTVDLIPPQDPSAFIVNNTGSTSAIEGHSTGPQVPAEFAPTGVVGTSLHGIGVFGISNTAAGFGVAGQSDQGQGVQGSTVTGVGVQGFAAGPGDAISGIVAGFATGRAAFFGGPVDIIGNTHIEGNLAGPHGDLQVDGDLHVGGTLSKASGSFRIDHPLDPRNKYLSHSFVESPDMKNVYDGVVVLDAEGGAVVSLPAWFQALNADYRYQLTALGAPAPGLYVAAEIADNQFRIAGGRPGGRVSWQVTGIRHDAWANTHRIVVEEDKPAAEQGKTAVPAAGQ
jgi:hypothetical protein